MSSTKLISGTPGTMNKAQASRGWSGVSVQAGSSVEAQATSVEVKAARAMLM